MSRIKTASKLAEFALRHVGAYSINDQGANPVEFDIALFALDAAVAELVGSMRVWWLVPRSATFTIKPQTTRFNITEIAQTLSYDAQTGNFTIGLTATGTTSGATGLIVNDVDGGTTGTLELVDITGTFQDDEPITDTDTGAAVINGTTTHPIADADFNFFVNAELLNDQDEVLTDLIQQHRRNYDAIRDKDQESEPDIIYIDKTQPSPDIYIHPVVAAGQIRKIRMTWQEYATDLINNQGSGVTGIPQAWQRWAEYQTAFDCGTGLVTWLPAAELQILKGVADESRARLEGFAEHVKVYPRRTKARNF